MAAGDNAIGEDVWRQTKIGWHIAFGVLVVLAAVLVGTDQDASVTARAVTLALLVALSAVYGTLGARLLHIGHQPKGLLYVVSAGALIVGMFALQPVTGVLLAIFYPQLWALLPTRQAIVGTLAMVLAIGLALLLFGGWGVVLLTIVVSLAAALVVGLWVSKVLEQSMARARLVAELAATRSELAAVSRQAGILAERERLARDLHDTLAQGETSVLLLVRAARAALARDPADCARQLALAEQVTTENLGEVRALVGALTPTGLDGVSLPAAVRRLAERIGAELGVAVAVDTVGEYRELPASVEVPLYRAAQEALANVRKHAGADTVSVRLHYLPDEVTLRVSDDGRGYDPGAPKGFGMAGLEARVAAAGGAVEVDTAPGAGVRLAVSLPIGAA